VYNFRMARNVARCAPKSKPAARAIDWGAIGAGGGIVILTGLELAGFIFSKQNQIDSRITVCFILLIQAVLYVLLVRCVRPLQSNEACRYRLAYLSTSIIGLGAILLGTMSSTPFVLSRYIGWGLIVMSGGFCGALILTWLREGLAENNSPPTATIQQNVCEKHHRSIGAGEPLNPLKRAFDILVAIAGISFSAPFWLVSVFLIWLENPGPILFVKNSVTRGGKNFRQYKFRTMVRSAEAGTGPVLAEEQDERILYFGSLLRKTALDELPQLLNILRGEMSFVGPRPQRTVLVEGYLQSLPEYAERHRVLPGLAGLAQVAGDYYLTPRQKLRFDRLYIQYSSLGFDLKLLGLAFLITFWYRWQPGWNGRLPRHYLHPKSRRR